MGSSKKDAKSEGSSISSLSDDGECSTDEEKCNDRRRSASRSPKRRRSRRSRSRSRSRDRQSRSRSRSRNYERRRSSNRESRRSRSRSKSMTPSHRHYRSRSPRGHERQRNNSRENPSPSRCLGVFGMNLHTSERDLRDFFDRFGAIENVQVIYDQATHKSRGFAFVYFESVEDAIEAKNRAAGAEIDGHNVRIDFSFTSRAHAPTPGIYMGHRANGRQYSGDRSGGYNDGGGGHRSRGRSYQKGGDYRGGGRRGVSPYDDYDNDRRRRSRSVERDFY